MTKGELRKARKQARAEGKPLTGELAIQRGQTELIKAHTLHLDKQITKSRRAKEQVASKREQYAHYLDCGPGAWDDR